jgi:glycosyltransferase involved in cell wall biosynthesis
LYECGGAVVLEGMAVGLPVIATNWGGPADYLNESCGILVDPATRESFIEGLANAMIKLAKDPELRLSMGRAARLRVEREFDWQRKVDKTLEIYEEAVRRTKPRMDENVTIIPTTA